MNYEDVEPTFSARQGLVDAPIRFRAELSDPLRQPILDILRVTVGPAVLMASITRVLNPHGMTPPAERAGDIDLSEAESAVAFLPVKRILLECEWFRLYDVIEDIFGELKFYETELEPEDEEPRSRSLRRDLNAYLEYAGIGWKLVGNRIVSRGSEAFESVKGAAVEALEHSDRPTARSHIHYALQALSVRPNVNAPGAIYHAVGALEAVARDMVGDKNPTLGEILKHYPNLLPAPLNTAFSQVWGYASDRSRHVTEGHNPSNEEAELVVGLAASAVTYLTRKGPLQSAGPANQAKTN